MKVFIVDDSSSVIAKLINLLHQTGGIEVVGYSGNYSDAVREIAKNEIDLVLLDIRFPGGNGIDLIRFIKYKHPLAKVAMLTNYSFPQFRKECKEQGADYFFDKTKDIEKAIDVAAGNLITDNGF